MIQRLVRILVQSVELGTVIGKCGKTDGNRERTGHILMLGERRAYPGQQALGEIFSDSAPDNENELIPSNAGSHIRIAKLLLQDTPIRLRTVSPALWPKVSLMPLKSSMSMMPRRKAFSPAKTGFSLLARALRVSRPVSPSCSALRFKSLCAERNRLLSVSR